MQEETDVAESEATDIKDPAIINPDWADVNVEESEETEDTTSKNDTPNAKFICEYCPYKTDWKNNMTKHVISVHTDAKEIDWFQCGQCSYKGKTREYLTHHVKLRHPEVVQWFRCANCDYKTRIKQLLKIHMISKHSPSDRVEWFRCDNCHFRSKFKHGLRLHQKYHLPADEIKWIKCEKCTYKTRLKPDYKRHYLRHHAGDDGQWFKCGLCPYQHNVLRDLRNHLKKVHFLDEKTIIDSSIESNDKKYAQVEYKEKSCFKIVPEKLICLFCNFEAKGFKGILRHFSVHHNLVKLVQ